MTDQQVIAYIKDQVQIDEKFMSGLIESKESSAGISKLEYAAYQKGQIIGAERAMAFLRANGILKPRTRSGVTRYYF